MPRQRQTYIAQTQPGFEPIASAEISATLDGATLHGTAVVGDKGGMVRFGYAGDPRDLLELRTVEDVFVFAGEVSDLAPGFAALRQIEHMASVSPHLERAVRLVREVEPGRGGEGKLRGRVVARLDGRAPYRRLDTQQAVEKGIAARVDRRWRLVDEGGIELWLTVWPMAQAVLMLRLSDDRMRHRTYKIEHLPASLRPAAAAALVWLTRPAPDDVFLDPMCGAGTLLIERAHAGRYRLLLGGDESEEAVATTLANIGTRYQPIEVREWDARRLPIDAGSVSAIAVNLPFGVQLGSPAENRELYPAFLREAARVLRSGGRLVALTGDARTFAEALSHAGKLARRESYRVQLLGQRAAVYVADRT